MEEEKILVDIKLIGSYMNYHIGTDSYSMRCKNHDIGEFVKKQSKEIASLKKENEELKSVDFDKLMKSYTDVGKENTKLKEQLEQLTTNTEEKGEGWISVKDRFPKLEDCGTNYLLSINTNGTFFEYEIAEWFNPLLEGEIAEEEHEKPHFNAKISFVGQQTLDRNITHWKPLPKTP